MNPSLTSSMVSYSSSCKRKRDQDYSYDDEPFHRSKKPKNDVFLNYLPEDIGKSFVSHLKGALKRSSFTISDHTMLPIGHDESSELLKAIQDSEIYVVVLSANYSSSAKCLDELVLIMDSLIKFNKRRVFPIFFHVDPSHVRNQQGPFLEAFHGHDSTVDPQTVQKWRRALQDVGQRSGQTMQNGVDEADILMRIVEELEKMQSPQDLHVTDHHVGLGSRAQELISKLRLDCEDVLVVAVFGISGIGKTTVVKATYNSIATDFDVSCFLADIHYYCGKHNWKVKLQKELISSLTQNAKPSITRHNDGLTKIRKLLIRRKILLVLDDVDNFQQLEALGIHPAWFYNGSRIIVTTRGKNSLGNIPYLSYHTELLNRRESLNLFTRLMFSRDDHVDSKFVEEIVRRAGGLPLVLEVWSRHFKCRERKQWPTLLEKLKRIPHEDIQQKLQLSYDALTPRAKKLFLDIACFFDGCQKDVVIKVLEDEDNAFFPDLEIQDLIDKGLVKDLHGHLTMHDVIREMGLEVVRKENEDDPGQRSRLVDPKDAVGVLRDCSGADLVRSICLNSENLKEDVTVQLEAFSKMSNVRFLKLVDYHLQWSYSCSNGETKYPLCFKHLKYLEWRWRFPFKCMDNLEMGNVVVIKLQYSKLETLWEGAFKSLKKLRILDVSFSSHLNRTGSFIGLENLEELDLYGCGNLEELDTSIGCLQKLVTLNLWGCIQLKRVPWEMIGKLTSLVRLNLGICPNILNISHQLVNLKSLKELYLKGNSFPSLPDSVCQLHQLKVIELSSCDNLKSIPNLPPNIKEVGAGNCRSLVSLPTNMSELQFITNLVLDNCIKLGSEGFVKVTGLRNLEVLWMRNCNVSQVSNEIGGLVSLEDLDLSGNTFPSLPDSISNLSRLKFLHIDDCHQLKVLPLLPSELREIEAGGCGSLDMMPYDTRQKGYIFRSQWCRHLLVNSQLEPSFSRHLTIGLSGKEDVIPEWCSYTSISGEVSFVAPTVTTRHLDKKKICGLIFYANSVCCYLSVRITMLNKTKGTRHWFDGTPVSVFMGLYPLNDGTIVVEAGDTLVIQYHKAKFCIATSFGLRLIYEDDVVDDSTFVFSSSSHPKL